MPLLESRSDELRVVYSAKGKDFTRAIENNLHYSGTRSAISVDEIHAFVESSQWVTLLNRGRAKSEGFAMSRLSMMTSLHGETTRLVKVGIFPRRERVSRFGRVGGWQWIETGVILLDSKIIFVKGDLSLVKALMVENRGDTDVIIPPFPNEIILDLVGCIALYDTSFVFPTGYHLRLVSQYGESDILSFSTEEDLNDWIASINYLSATHTALTPQDDPSISPAVSRRRAGTMAPPAGCPVPLRAVSSTLELRLRSKSDQVATFPNPDKLTNYITFQTSIEKKLPLQKMAVDAHLRQARGLLIQTPLQDRTRVTVLNALERVTRRLKSSRVEMERGLCYLDVLRNLISIISVQKVRLVETETEEFLPSLGFVGHRRRPSEATVDTMLSSTTLYTTLHPSEDISGVPVRRIGTPSLSIKSSPTSAKGSVTGIPSPIAARPEITDGSSIKGISPVMVTRTEIVDGPASPSLQLEKCESAPGNMARGKTSLAENVDPVKSTRDTIRVAEITRIVREGGF